MKIMLNNTNGTFETKNVASLIITLGSGETIEISDESQRRPSHLSEGVTIWGGRMPEEDASVDDLRASTRLLGIYPMAANMIHVFPICK